MVYLQEDSSSTESYSEGSRSEEGVLTGDEVSEDGDYDDEEDDVDIEIEDDYDAESDFHSETDDGDEVNDFDLEEEDDPECNLSGSSGERSCNEGSGADNRKVCAYSFHKKTTSVNNYKLKNSAKLVFIMEKMSHAHES